jgi:hypothetical protein
MIPCTELVSILAIFHFVARLFLSEQIEKRGVFLASGGKVRNRIPNQLGRSKELVSPTGI